MPSIQWLVNVAFTPDQLTIIAVNNTSSVTWLRNYRAQTGISYLFVYDQTSNLNRLYEVGSTFGNNPPSYLIIDKGGIVRYRVDQKYNRFDEMKAMIEGLSKQ